MIDNYQIKNVILTAREVTGKEYLADTVITNVVPFIVYDKNVNLRTVATIWAAYMEALSDTTESIINSVPHNYRNNAEGGYLMYISILRKLLLGSSRHTVDGINVTVVNCYWWDSPWVARTMAFNNGVVVTHSSGRAKVWTENVYIKRKIERMVSENFIISDPEIPATAKHNWLHKLLGVKNYTHPQKYVV